MVRGDVDDARRRRICAASSSATTTSASRPRASTIRGRGGSICRSSPAACCRGRRCARVARAASRSFCSGGRTSAPSRCGCCCGRRCRWSSSRCRSASSRATSCRCCRRWRCCSRARSSSAPTTGGASTARDRGRGPTLGRRRLPGRRRSCLLLLAVLLYRARPLFLDVVDRRSPLAAIDRHRASAGALAWWCSASRAPGAPLRRRWPLPLRSRSRRCRTACSPSSRDAAVQQHGRAWCARRTPDDEVVGTYRVFVRNLVFYTGIEADRPHPRRRTSIELAGGNPPRADRHAVELTPSGWRREPGLRFERLGALPYFDDGSLRVGTLLWPDPRAISRQWSLLTRGSGSVRCVRYEVPVTSHCLPGFRMPFGSNACLTRSISAIVVGRELEAEILRLREADAVLAGDRAFERDDAFEQLALAPLGTRASRRRRPGRPSG